MQRILVAVDGSKCAQRAFEVAAGLAKQLGSKMLAITVVDEPASVDVEGKPILDESRVLERNAHILLSDYAAKASQQFGIEIETAVWRGYPPKTIVDVAEQKGAGMIVIGSRGLSGLKEIVLGSVSHGVMNHSQVPVLIVK